MKYTDTMDADRPVSQKVIVNFDLVNLMSMLWIFCWLFSLGLCKISLISFQALLMFFTHPIWLGEFVANLIKT